MPISEFLASLSLTLNSGSKKIKIITKIKQKAKDEESSVGCSIKQLYPEYMKNS
ncbi:hypothetical protein SMIDD26_01242 [Streptococcus mitis]|uniref:Uncharacterized protein n=1 Tax=Streptococcus mitis TaxID=28037 RepID=A0A139PQ91_STRMT|nr:hypothetical protein SMIDD26_01242 [Streptococcus mitis]